MPVSGSDEISDMPARSVGKFSVIGCGLEAARRVDRNARELRGGAGGDAAHSPPGDGDALALRVRSCDERD
jgi:hypothetical protein